MTVLSSAAGLANAVASGSLVVLALVLMMPARRVAVLYFSKRREIALVLLFGAVVRGTSLTPFVWLKEGARVSSAVVAGLTAAVALYRLWRPRRAH